MGNLHCMSDIQSMRIKLEHKTAPLEGLVTSAQTSLPLCHAELPFQQVWRF